MVTSVEQKALKTLDIWVPLKVPYSVKAMLYASCCRGKMLDYVCIFTQGGALLWTWSLMSSGLRGDPIKEFIHQILIPMRTSESAFSYKPPTGAEYILKWALHNVRALTVPHDFYSVVHIPVSSQVSNQDKALSTFSLRYQRLFV